EELSVKSKELRKMQCHYQDVVPRADFDRLTRKHTQLNKTHKLLSSTHEQLRDQYDTLLGIYESAVTERDELREESQTLRRSATPRPDWNRVAEFVEGGIARWRDLSMGKTSDQIVDALISELTGSQLASSSEVIDCKGTENSVPVYLRYEGSIRNRRLGKNDILILINDIWKEKQNEDNQESMEVFVDKYFKD
ncbi:unnamed protein product, partial [Meganyctiphanes norvegica]